VTEDGRPRAHRGRPARLSAARAVPDASRARIVIPRGGGDRMVPADVRARQVVGYQLVFGTALALLLTGCSSVGPAVLARDRFDYSSAVADSWKRQTLLNIVKLRYLDSPIFLDVAQIVSGYQLQTTVSASGTAAVDPSSLPTIGSFVNFGAQGSFTDRPTITYVPLTGDQYIRGIVTPLRPEQVFSAILAGWPAEAILFTAVSTVNGLGNQRLAGITPRAADPRFLRVARLIGSLQASGAVGFRFLEGKTPATRSILFFRRGELSESERQEIAEVRQLLGLNPDTHEFELVFGPTPASDREIAVQTRSLVQILLEVGGNVSVPASHIAEGRATPGLADPAAAEIIRHMRIHSSTERSAHAFLSVPYRDHWFWIDDRDLTSKRGFALLMILFALADTGEKKAVPLLTIPAQ
jgi:hypothetical protein